MRSSSQNPTPKSPDDMNLALLSPLEHLVGGSSLPADAIKNPGDAYRPRLVIERLATPADANEQRKKYPFFLSSLGIVIGISDRSLAVSLEELDAEGKTQHDPRVLGLFNKETGQVEQVEGRDLDKELREKFKEYGVEGFFRDAPTTGEQEGPGGIES